MGSQKVKCKTDEVFLGMISDFKFLERKSALCKNNKRAVEKVRKMVSGNQECIQLVDELIQEQKAVHI